ncbi:MAG: hypothetical protein LC775_03210 [Acidobacteria bacterium]|nr:hypothetical protein [Acidobacteriota bacterium]
MALSRIGKQVEATRSGHHIQFDEPDLVVATIREVLQASGPRSRRVMRLNADFSPAEENGG